MTTNPPTSPFGANPVPIRTSSAARDRAGRRVALLTGAAGVFALVGVGGLTAVLAPHGNPAVAAAAAATPAASTAPSATATVTATVTVTKAAATRAASSSAGTSSSSTATSRHSATVATSGGS